MCGTMDVPDQASSSPSPYPYANQLVKVLKMILNQQKRKKEHICIPDNGSGSLQCLSMGFGVSDFGSMLSLLKPPHGLVKK